MQMDANGKGGLVHEALTSQIIGAAIEVHKELGPGLLESTYESCLCHEFLSRGISFQRQVEVPVLYKGQFVDCGYRIDILVGRVVAIELKSVQKLTPIDEAQLMTYLKLGRFPVGLLINFNTMRLVDGLVRRANTQPRSQ